MNPLLPKIFQANRYFIQEINDKLKPFGIFYSQWSILYLVDHYGAMTLTEIWQQLNVEAPTVTRTVTRLESLGWIERQQGADKRAKIITLTKEGQEKMPAIVEAVMGYEAMISQKLTAEEQQQLLYLLAKMKG